jgi:hypothetical protein
MYTFSFHAFLIINGLKHHQFIRMNIQAPVLFAHLL